MTLVFSLTKIAMTVPQFPFASATAARAASNMVGSDRSLSAAMPASSRIWRPSSAFVPSRRITIGARRSTRPIASTMPFATSSPRVMPPKMLMKIDFDVLVEVDHLERSGHHVGVGAAADVEEVGGGAADLVDDVERRHGEPGAVGDDADRPVEADVLQVLLLGQLLALVEFLGGAERLPLGVAERGVAVEGDLRVERVHLTGRLEDQRVDLGEVAVALGEAAVQLHEDVGGAVERPLGQLGVDARLAGGGRDRARRPGRCAA